MKKIMIICLPILLFCSILSAQGSGNSIEHTYINCGSNSSLSLLGSFTIEAWIYPLENDIIGEHSIIDRRYGDGGYQLRLGGSVSFRLRAIGGAEYAISASGLVANKWQHIAGVYRYDSESGNHYHEIYINGVLKAGPTNLGTFTRGNNDTEFYIGRSKLVSTFLLNGEIDEVRAWSKALTAEEIQNNMCTKLSGSNADLEGYWRFDEADGICVDLSNNDNNSTNNPARVVSGAPIGDASVNDYSSPSPLSFYFGSGDGITANSFSGSPDAFQIYRVDSAPNVTTPPGNLVQLSPEHYFGVFMIGGTTPTYTLTYNYNGHPGITDETKLDLAKRADNATTSWTETNATLDTDANTLTLTGESGTEYILGAESGGGTLPVELSSFTAQYLNNTATLYWETQSEIDNMGWFIYRNDREDFSSADLISELIEGHETTTQQQSYIFEDRIQNSGVVDIYYYWLESIDYSGIVNYYDKVAVLTIPDQNDPNNGAAVIPEIYGLYQNEPNPFISSTKISFNLPATAHVNLSIYNISGQLLKTLFLGHAQSNTLTWDGKDDVGIDQKNGIYLYKLEVDGNVQQVKKLILMN